MKRRCITAIPRRHALRSGVLVRQSPASASALPPPFKKEAFGSGSPQRFSVFERRTKAHHPKGSFGKGAEPSAPSEQGSARKPPCGDTARPLRTVGPVMAQAVTEDCLTCAAAANCRGCRRRRLRVVVFPQPAKIKFAPRSPSPFLKYQLRILLQSTTISPYPSN